jgi:hypothetical protein
MPVLGTQESGYWCLDFDYQYVAGEPVLVEEVSDATFEILERLASNIGLAPNNHERRAEELPENPALPRQELLPVLFFVIAAVRLPLVQEPLQTRDTCRRIEGRKISTLDSSESFGGFDG